MRIIGGELGGRRIKTIAATCMRPTTDRVREAIFSSLVASYDFSEFVAADLYAGTGAMGFEALSRGVESCVFVERDRKLCKVLSENIKDFGLELDAKVLEREMPSALSGVADLFSRSAKRRLILADPPYTAHPEDGLFQALLDKEILVEGAVLICGRPKKMEYGFPEVDFASLGLAKPEHRAKNYGDIVIDYYLF